MLDTVTCRQPHLDQLSRVQFLQAALQGLHISSATAGCAPQLLLLFCRLRCCCPLVAAGGPVHLGLRVPPAEHVCCVAAPINAGCCCLGHCTARGSIDGLECVLVPAAANSTSERLYILRPTVDAHTAISNAQCHHGSRYKYSCDCQSH